MSQPAQSESALRTGQRGLRPTFDELSQNTRLLIRLRWIAGGGILLGTAFARLGLDITLDTLALGIIGCFVLAHNLTLFIACQAKNKTLTRARRVAWIQIILDWVAMVLLVHFTGGITSPALIYFVIHAALAGTILVPWETRALAVIAIGYVLGLASLESSGVIPHVIIPEMGLDSELYQDNTYIAGVLFFFGTTVLTLSELVTRKSQQARRREEHIRQLYEARSTFLRVATHELRAPLAAGLSLVRNIEAGYAGSLNPQQNDLMKRVQKRLEGLSLLVDDLLTLAASREASLAQTPLEPVQVRTILEQVIERERPNADKKHIRLHENLAGQAAVVMGGDTGLAIIFGNLLNNAIKYTGENGDVTIEYRVNTSDDTVHVTFSDTGIGIPLEDQPHIFEEFHRARNVLALQVSGTGIGLSAVQTLLHRYNGQIHLQSVENEGTTFEVTLPLAGPPSRFP